MGTQINATVTTTVYFILAGVPGVARVNKKIVILFL